MASFELDRRSVAGGAVAPLGAVEHLDVVEDVGAGVVAGLEIRSGASTYGSPSNTG